MPTAAKIVAALLMAALGYLTSETIKPLMSEATNFGYFSWVNAGIGLLCGWIIVGPRAGSGLGAAISNGLTGVAALVFWGLLVQSVNEMVELSLRHHYGSALEAAAAVFELMVEYGAILLQSTVITTLLVGAVVVGLVTEKAGRAWR